MVNSVVPLRAALVWVYGAYGFSFDIRLSSQRLSLLDRGVRLAVHVREGAELGPRWRRAATGQSGYDCVIIHVEDYKRVQGWRTRR